jgi:signal transduction histidine kinase
VQKKITVTPIQKALEKIRPAWITRVGQELARGMEVRAGFEEQLERFFELLEQSVTTGDPAWMEPILLDWAKSSTETDLEEGLYHVSFLINRMIALTIQVSRESLTKQQTLDLLAAVIPIYTYGLEVVARYEMETRVAHISSEMEKVQKRMERVDKSKSAFISVAAHELKTPITLIEGYASMMDDLMRDKKASNLDGLLAGMNTGINRLRSIVDDMIDVSLIDNQLLTLNFQPIQIAHTISAIEMEVASVLANRKLTLELLEFDGSKQWIYADATRLMQAILNVINNAIKYTPDGGKITVDGRKLPGFIEVIVADTGIGISAENQAIIFEKFGQLGRVELHSSGKTSSKGAVRVWAYRSRAAFSRHMVARIWVESEGFDELRCPGSTVPYPCPSPRGYP